MTTLPRISTYIDQETIKKFKIVASYNNMSMSELLKKMIETEISLYDIPDNPDQKVRKSYALRRYPTMR